MAFTVHFHTNDDTKARVVDLSDEQNADLIVVRIGRPGDEVTILGTLANVQDAIDDAAAQLAKLSLFRGERELAESA